MAKSVPSFEWNGLTYTDAYLMIGATNINHFQETVALDIYVFVSEAARNQDPSIDENLRRPIAMITVRPLFDDYLSYLLTASDDLTAFVYSLIVAVPAGIGASPAGMQEILAGSSDI